MTPATLALITAVGPPDCATNKLPANSAIICQANPRAPGSESLSDTRELSKSRRHLANGENGCQKEIRRGKLQSNSHAQNTNRCGKLPTAARVLDLELGASLEFGVWDLELYTSTTGFSNVPIPEMVMRTASSAFKAK